MRELGKLYPLLVILSLGAPRTSHAQVVCPAGATTRGVDVSQHQGSIDWSAVSASGIRFGIARAVDGQLTDAKFKQNWDGIRAAGLVRGAYDFFEPQLSAADQAATYLATVGSFGSGDLDPILDVEVAGGQSAFAVANGVATWVSVVRAATGRNPIVYTGAAFWNNFLGDPSSLGTDLWIASWGRGCPNIPGAWANWTIWQSSVSANVSGIAGAADLDQFNGSEAQLLAYAAVTDTPEPASLALLGTGLLAVFGLRWRRRAA